MQMENDFFFRGGGSIDREGGRAIKSDSEGGGGD